jgi:hypothetical protein
LLSLHEGKTNYSNCREVISAQDELEAAGLATELAKELRNYGEFQAR